MKIILFSLVLLVSAVAKGAPMTQMEVIKDVFTRLRADNLDILDSFYDPRVQFLDPLGLHDGRDSVKEYYRNLYKNVTSISFDYTDSLSADNNHLLVWTMNLVAPAMDGGKPVVVHGNSVIKFNEQDLVIYHRDYFDMGEFVYERVPILRWVIAKVKTRLRPH